jgi:CAP-Gly domain
VPHVLDQVVILQLWSFNGIRNRFSLSFLHFLEPITPEIHDRVIVKSAAGSKVGILRYKGEPHFASGVWCGVEFDEAIGKNDGSVSGQR